MPFLRSFGIFGFEVGRKGDVVTWHTLSVQNALVAVRAKENVQFQQLVKVMVYTSSMQIFASIVGHVPRSVQLRHQIQRNYFIQRINAKKESENYSPFLRSLTILV